MVANVAAAASRLSVGKVTKGDGDGSSIHEGNDEMSFWEFAYRHFSILRV